MTSTVGQETSTVGQETSTVSLHEGWVKPLKPFPIDLYLTCRQAVFTGHIRGLRGAVWYTCGYCRKPFGEKDCAIQHGAGIDAILHERCDTKMCDNVWKWEHHTRLAQWLTVCRLPLPLDVCRLIGARVTLFEVGHDDILDYLIDTFSSR